MPKDKLSLSKKTEYLIDKIAEIPTVEEISHSAWSNNRLIGNHIDFRCNTEKCAFNDNRNAYEGNTARRNRQRNL